MEEKLIAMCDSIVEDRKVLKKKMLWEADSDATAIMSAFLYASAGKRADVERYVKCKKLLKKNASIFSEFRGIAFTLVTTRMALSDDPEKYVQGSLQVYKKLRSLHKLTASPYMVMAALNIYEKAGLEGSDEYIEKLETLYKKLKSEHPMLIWDQDRAYLSMLVTSGLNVDRLTEETEACYEAVKKVYFDRDAVHSLAQVLALNPQSPESKAEMVKELIAGFKKAKVKVSKQFGLTAVGALTMLDLPLEDIVSKTAEVDEYLRHQKGFSCWRVSPKIRHMYSQLIVAMNYLPQTGVLSGSVAAQTITLVLIEEIIMLIIVYSCVHTTTHSASSSSNGSN